MAINRFASFLFLNINGVPMIKQIFVVMIGFVSGIVFLGIDDVNGFYQAANQRSESDRKTSAVQRNSTHEHSVHSGIKDAITAGLTNVGTVSKPVAWDRFQIFVWQFKTNAQLDAELYQRVGLFAFHVDRGAGQDEKINWAIKENRPYYIDHAAGKGILHLTERSGLGKIRSDGSLQPRPQSLISNTSIETLTKRLSDNLRIAGKGPVAAIALDDEVSLGTFNTPMEVDSSPESVLLFRLWLTKRYRSIENLNQQWGTAYSNFDSIQPVSFETARQQIAKQPFSKWNLSRWIDWRSYMDTQFSATLAHLVRHANEITPNVPAGIVGGQQPSAFGGFDYSKISKSVQWIESYDIGGTNELLTSLWHDSRRPIVQTYFSTGDASRDNWFLWYYWAHGNSACIAWPDMNGKPWFKDGRIREDIERLTPSFRQLQSPKLSLPSDPKSKFEFDPIAILYSHPSVQLSWATDALVHGKTWPRRSSSLDNDCSSAGKNRIAWSKLLEDCGFQTRWISTEQLEAGELESSNFKALILPRTLALGPKSVGAIQQFHKTGGCVVADYWTGLFDEHGKAIVEDEQLKGSLDDLFKISRHESAGYFDGETITEINGELYKHTLLDRLPKADPSKNRFPKVELGTTNALNIDGVLRDAEVFTSANRAFYLNSSPVAYCDPTIRMSDTGENWRNLMRRLLASVKIEPKVVAWLNDKRIPMIEVLRWRKEKTDWIIVVSNPTRSASVNGAGKSDWESINGELVLKFSQPHAGGFDVRTGNTFKAGNSISVQFDAKSATVLQLND